MSLCRWLTVIYSLGIRKAKICNFKLHVFKTKLHCIALIATFVTDNLFLTVIQPWRKESPLISPNGLQFSQPLLLTKPFLPSKLRSLQPKLWSWKIKESSKSETNLLFLITFSIGLWSSVLTSFFVSFPGALLPVTKCTAPFSFYTRSHSVAFHSIATPSHQPLSLKTFDSDRLHLANKTKDLKFRNCKVSYIYEVQCFS